MTSRVAPASLRAALAHTRPAPPHTNSAVTARITSARPFSSLPTKRVLPTAAFKSIRAPFTIATRRHAHSIPRPSSTSSSAPKPNTPKQPHYELTFTCVPCGTRSAHNISKQGYHHGTVLITCPSCRNRHIISDHLNIFGNRKITIEELMRERGQLVKRGTLGEDGDVEFWEDGSTTNRGERQGDSEGQDPKPKVSGSGSGGSQAAADEQPGASWGKA